MTIFVNRFYGMQKFDVPIVANATEPFSSFLIMPPGDKLLFPDSRDCSKPGLYQVWIPMDESGGSVAYLYNRIVALTGYDLATGVANLCNFGNSDGSLTPEYAATAALNARLNLQCGQSATLIKYLANAIGIQCRICHVVTAGDINGYSDGHETIEMWQSGAWRLFDASLCFVPRDTNGNHLNLFQTVEGFQTNSVISEPIAPFQGSAERTSVHYFHPESWIRANDLTNFDNRIEKVVKHDYQIPFIEAQDGIWGYLPIGTENQKDYVLGLGYALMSRDDFISRFY